jgi:hypothetical protein
MLGEDQSRAVTENAVHILKFEARQNLKYLEI